jgi:transcriptional regulator with GAF, ATPase, and Fis domain
MADEQDAEVVRVAELFSSIARLLSTHADLRTTLDRIVRMAAENLDACEFAGLSIVNGRKISSPAATDPVPTILDAIQQEVDEGPCLDAIRQHEVFRTGDLAAETRWPRFAARANAETGIRSVLALRLFVEEDTLGALNLYSSVNDAFDDTDVALGSVFAAHAGIALSSAQREHDLERKAQTRDVIGRAKGILTAQSHVSDEQAFDLLRRASQRLNIKLVDVAEQIVAGSEPGQPEAS